MTGAVASPSVSPRLLLPPPLLVLLLLLPLLLLGTAQACMETAWSSGRMDGDQRLRAMTLPAPRADSCVCCAFCHHQPGCASLSFNQLTGDCELYSSVASYATLQPDSEEEWTYFVMPGRSETGQFCREDSDCLEDGEFCRGRFCTALDKVSCRTVADTFGSIRHYSTDPVIYGYINGVDVKTYCWMTREGEGFTTILWSENGLRFNSTALMQYNRCLWRTSGGQSLLRLAEHLRKSESDPTYQIHIWTQDGSDWNSLLSFESPRSEPVLSDAARTDAWLNDAEDFYDLPWSPSMLWTPASGPTLLTINAEDGQSSLGALARANGIISNDAIWVYMHE